MFMPNRHKPIGKTKETLLDRYEETMATQQKIRDAGFLLFRFGGVNLEKFSVTILALKLTLIHTPM
jgi:hypothetical protein